MSVYEHAECTYSPRRASSLSVGGKASLTLPLLALVLNLTAVAAILVSQTSHFSLTCFSAQGTPLSLKQGERKSDRQREGWGEWTLFTLVRVNSIGLPEHTLTNYRRMGRRTRKTRTRDETRTHDSTEEVGRPEGTWELGVYSPVRDPHHFTFLALSRTEAGGYL